MNTLNQLETLSKVYDPTSFRELGHELIDLLADHLEKVQYDNNASVINYRTPEDELKYWQEDFNSGDKGIGFFKNILDHSISVHHPKYMGHQVAVPSTIAALSGLVSDLLSNGTGVYDMGMASNALEKIVTNFVAKYIGYDKNGSGILTSGGTLANLTALLAARRIKSPSDVWNDGHQEKLAVMVSEEAHYCIDRAARIMGMGSSGIIKIPVDTNFRIKTNVLEEYMQIAKSDGLKVIAIVGCASSTATGSYDDLDVLADFAEKHDLWFHVDGAHGGAVVFSEKYKHLVNGINRADSVVIDFHKILMTPALNTALIFKQRSDNYKVFEQKAQYLWDSQSTEEWYNSGKRTFECTKLMMSIKVYSILKTHGTDVFEKNVNRLYDMGRAFSKMIKERSDFELAIDPHANIVNFRYVGNKEQPQDYNQLNDNIRQRLIEDGKFYIVKTTIRTKRYLRVSIMNPMTTEKDCGELLDEIEKIGCDIYKITEC